MLQGFSYSGTALQYWTTFLSPSHREAFDGQGARASIILIVLQAAEGFDGLVRRTVPQCVGRFGLVLPMDGAHYGSHCARPRWGTKCVLPRRDGFAATTMAAAPLCPCRAPEITNPTPKSPSWISTCRQADREHRLRR